MAEEEVKKTGETSTPETKEQEKIEASPTPETKKRKKAAKPRKSLKRKLFNILIVVVVVIGVLIVLRDLVVKHAVEKAGSFLVGTQVKMGYFHSSLLGKVHVKDLTVANPEGYNHPHAFELGEVRVDLNVSSLFTDKIEVRHIYVEGVNVDYELKLGRSNLGEIQSNLERFAPKKDDDDDDDDKDKDEEKPQKQAVIRLLQTTNCSLSFSNSTLGTTLKMPLPGLNLKDLGDGKPIGETVNDLFGLIMTSITKAVSGVGGVITESAQSAGKAITDLFK